MDVVGEHSADGGASRGAVGVYAEEDVAGEVELDGISAGFNRTARHLVPGPTRVAGAHDRAELDPIGPGAGRVEHAGVHRTDVDRHGRPREFKVQSGGSIKWEHV